MISKICEFLKISFWWVAKRKEISAFGVFGSLF
jgi:hypothetical protein